MKAVVMKSLLKVARSILQNVIADVVQQGNIIKELSERISGSFVPLLESWQGTDADAFREEITRDVIPMVMDLAAAILGIQTGIESAVNRIETADKKCAGQVDNLANQFRAII